MAAKHTGLGVATLELDGVSYLGRGTNFSVDHGADSERVQGFGDTYSIAQILGRSHRFTFDLMEDVSGSRKADPFSVSALTMDGNNMLALVESLNLDVSVPVDDNGGMSDFHAVGQVVGARTVSGTATMKILQSALSSQFLIDAQSSTPADNNWTFSLNPGFGGGPVTLPVVQQGIGKAVPRDGFQTLNVAFEGGGAPSAVPASGLIATVFGDALVTLNIDTGAGVYAVTAVVERYNLAIARRQVQRQTLTVMTQGAPGYAATT